MQAWCEKPVRLVVTGTNKHNRSFVVSDTVAPEPPGVRGNHLWCMDRVPVPLTPYDNGLNQHRDRDVPPTGGVFLVAQLPGWPPNYETPVETPPVERPRGGWSRGGMNIHRTQSVDYGIVLAGERLMWLDEGVKLIRSGDVIVQLGGWHGWGGYDPSRVAFVMMGATFDE
jgi:hypothetical protein